MYMVASVCTWFLRAWKIGQLECVAATEGKQDSEVDVVPRQQIQRTFSREAQAHKSTFSSRMFSMKKV